MCRTASSRGTSAAPTSSVRRPRARRASASSCSRRSPRACRWSPPRCRATCRSWRPARTASPCRRRTGGSWRRRWSSWRATPSCAGAWASTRCKRPAATRGTQSRQRSSRSTRKHGRRLPRSRPGLWRCRVFTTRFEAWVRRHAEALMAALGRTPLTPNQVTVVGLGLTFLAAALAAFGELRWAGVVLIFAGTCDILDGALARSTKASYPYGAFLDSTLDRYSEGAVYLGLAAYFVTIKPPLQEWLILATLAALAGSFLVSYVRARAQSLGFACKTGLFQRPERVVVTVIGLLLGGWWLYGIVFLLAIVTNITALQRIREVWLQGRAQRLEREREIKAQAKASRPAPNQAP